LLFFSADHADIDAAHAMTRALLSVHTFIAARCCQSPTNDISAGAPAFTERDERSAAASTPMIVAAAQRERELMMNVTTSFARFTRRGAARCAQEKECARADKS